MGAFDKTPPWYEAALHELGVRELPENRGPDIRRYIALAKCGAEGEPWCSTFANAMLEVSGVRGTRNASSQSFRNDPHFVRLSGPTLGAICVFWRGSPHSGLGHVGFYRGERDGYVWVLGGNEGDMTQIEAFPKQSSSFGLIGYWWPKGYPLPSTGVVKMSADSPSHTTKVT